MAALPQGTVTLLFTDVEGSTQLQHRLGDAYQEVVAEHRRLLEQAFAAHDGVVVDRQTESFFVAFARARQAIAALRDHGVCVKIITGDNEVVTRKICKEVGLAI